MTLLLLSKYSLTREAGSSGSSLLPQKLDKLATIRVHRDRPLRMHASKGHSWSWTGPAAWASPVMAELRWPELQRDQGSDRSLRRPVPYAEPGSLLPPDDEALPLSQPAGRENTLRLPAG